MKKLEFLLLIAFLLLYVNIYATSQGGDEIIYRGDTMKLYGFPLDDYPNKKVIDPEKSFKFGQELNTGYWRGYVATWSIVDNQLYLIRIQNPDRDKKADLKAIFGDKYENGKVFADWFSGKLYCEKGRVVYKYNNDFSTPIYEKEIEVQIKNGKCLREVVYDNSKSRQIDYKYVFTSGYTRPNGVREHVDSLINWSIIPKISGEDISVRVRFSGNEDGVMDSVTLLNPRGDVFDSEAVRVVKTLPANVQIIRGKFKRVYWEAPIIFSESSRKK